MDRSFEKMLVEQCAPTLAGIKPANLFRVLDCDRELLQREVSYWNRELSHYGIFVKNIKECPETNSVLVYVYRKKWVEEILSRLEVKKFLKQQRYLLSNTCEQVLEQLSYRLCLGREFPHEIGIFLGYPLEDVIGFIENKGQNYTCCGFWKTYGDPKEARHRFEGYRTCINKCTKMFDNGIPVIQLLAAV